MKCTAALEKIIQHGCEELSDFQDFLALWLTYLGGKAEHSADSLILEAASLLSDVSLAVKYAEKYVAVHPGLYLGVLENGKHMATDKMSAIGMKAIQTIPKKYIARSTAALKTAEYNIEADKESALLEKCYF